MERLIKVVFKIFRMFPELPTGDAVTGGGKCLQVTMGQTRFYVTIFVYGHTSLVLKISDRVERKVTYTRKCSIFKTQQAFN